MVGETDVGLSRIRRELIREMRSVQLKAKEGCGCLTIISLKIYDYYDYTCCHPLLDRSHSW